MSDDVVVIVMCQVLSDAATNAWSSRCSQIISFYFVKKVNSPVPLHPFRQGVRESAGITVIVNAGAFFVFATDPSYTDFSVDLKRGIFAFAAFSSRTKMVCDAVEFRLHSLLDYLLDVVAFGFHACANIG